MTRHIVRTNQASIDTSVDGHGPVVVVVPSYGRDAGGSCRCRRGHRLPAYGRHRAVTGKLFRRRQFP